MSKALADTYYQELMSLLRQLHSAADFDSIFPQLDRRIRTLLKVRRLTIYQRDNRTGDLVSRFKTNSDTTRIRVPISTTSLAGFIALTGNSLRVENVRDSASLAEIHPNLRFDDRFEKHSGFTSRSMLIIPLFSGQILLGVLQLMRGIEDPPFTAEEQEKAEQIGELIGQKFKYDLGCTSSPFEGLILQGLLSQETLTELRAKASPSLPVSEMVLALPGVTRESLGRSLELFYQVPFVTHHPDDYQLHSVCSEVSPAFLKNNSLVFLSFQGGERVTVLIDDPSDRSRMVLIENFLGERPISFCVGLRDDIYRYLGEKTTALAPSKNLNKLLDELESEDTSPSEIIDDDSTTGLNEQDSKIITLVNEVLGKGFSLKASDIHIEPGRGKEAATIRMRVDGICQHVGTVPASYVPAVVSRLKVMSRLDIAERRLPQDGKLSIKTRGHRIEARVATLPTVNGEGIVIRLLQSGAAIEFNKLQLSRNVASGVKSIIKHPHGLILVVGPTGSGKTTTLHSILSLLNSPEKKIWTAEDPVEITQPGLQQVQVNPNIGLSFAAALRSFLRADPDIVLIGEMRDLETAHTAIEASLTGHLVLSTLHTNSAAETLLRLLDLGIDPVSFADALLGVLAQRLVRTLCPDCKQRYIADAQEVSFLRRQYGESLESELSLTEPVMLYKPIGCSRCNDTGYRGRIGIHELLVSTSASRELLYHKATLSKLKEQAAQDGMRTLLQDGILKVLAGKVDLKQLHRVTI